MKKKRKETQKPKVGYLSFSGLESYGEDPEGVFSKLMEWLLPSVSYLTGRSQKHVRNEIRGPTIHPVSRLQGECKFDNGGLSCEIILYEGLFLSLRCFAEILATQMALPQDDVSMLGFLTGADKPSVGQGESMQRSKAIEIMEAVLERFWQKPNDPLGLTDWDFLDKARMFRPDYVRPIADVLPTLNAALKDSSRREWAQMLVQSASLFVLAHELGHYILKQKMGKDSLAEWAAAIRACGFREPESTGDDWAANWAVEFRADMEANDMLLHFGQRIARNEIKVVKYNGDPNAVVASWSIESYSSIFFTLACVHLIEMYGWARFGKPFPLTSHPPAMRRRHLLVGSIPPEAVLQLTSYGELIWTELEALFSDVLDLQIRKNRLCIKGRDKAETLEYFASVRKRFQESYIQGDIVNEVKNIHKQSKKGTKEEVDTLIHLGLSHSRRGEYQEAIDIYRKGLKIARHTSDKRKEIDLLVKIGKTQVNLHRSDDSLKSFEQAVAILEDLLTKIGKTQFNLLGYSDFYDSLEQGFAKLEPLLKTELEKSKAAKKERSEDPS